MRYISGRTIELGSWDFSTYQASNQKNKHNSEPVTESKERANWSEHQEIETKCG